MSDEHLLKCISKLHNTYLKCQKEMDLKTFYKNKVDPIKFYFDMTFNYTNIENHIVNEINRKNDKTINNAIGHFHQNLFNGIKGFEAPNSSGYDIRKLDNTIFAELKNKHNTMNSSSQAKTFEKLENLAEKYPNSTCYLVEVIATKSQNILWEFTNHKHDRIRRISIDKFYELITGRPYAFKELCDAIAIATKNMLKNSNEENLENEVKTNNKVYNKLNKISKSNDLNILSQIFKDTFEGFNGF